MPIFGQNSILNGFIPKFLLKTPLDGQILVWDSDVNGFVNASPTNYLVTGLTPEERKQFNLMKQWFQLFGNSFKVPDESENDPITATALSGTVTLQGSADTIWYTANVEWGDGVVAQISNTAPQADFIKTHTYSTSGTYTIKLTFVNAFGLGETITKTITISLA